MIEYLAAKPVCELIAYGVTAFILSPVVPYLYNKVVERWRYLARPYRRVRKYIRIKLN
jgi:hypothetical protein